MRGHQHYTEAERMAADVVPHHLTDSDLLRLAQVHATLALAAATAAAASGESGTLTGYGEPT